MKIAVDIDETITKYPEFFSSLSQQHDIVIVTSRMNTEQEMKNTEQLMLALNIEYSKIYFCDWTNCPNDDVVDDLIGSERLLYQKVEACVDAEVSAIFDDDPTVQRLIKKYLPQVAVFSPI